MSLSFLEKREKNRREMERLKSINEIVFLFIFHKIDVINKYN